MRAISGNKILTYFIFPLNPFRRILLSIGLGNIIGVLLPTLHGMLTFLYILTMLLYNNGGAGKTTIGGAFGLILALIVYRYLGTYILVFIIVGYVLGYLQIVIDLFKGKLVTELKDNFD